MVWWLLQKGPYLNLAIIRGNTVFKKNTVNEDKNAAAVFFPFFFYNNVVQKLKLCKIHITVPRQEYCVLTGEKKNPMQ